ncbi:serine protease [Rhodospirillales bacterium TMPK1]|uniref:Serine protease n=2 Tax=Roseiterribacter gracilis TaxID=2812848 RepID=A0A8S8XA92_9PROT|nr:serine protease [Rhodospirillales bacterium TMPK1]
MAQSAPPSLDLLLTPHVQNGAVRDVGVTLKLEKPNVAEGTALLRMPTLIVSIPATRYDGDAVQARDDAGPLPLTQKDEAPTPTGTYRQWLPTRATVGDVVVTAKAPPRVVDATTRTGPLFDLRADGGGVLGAGITFLPLPNTKNPYRLRVHWDLAALGPDATGAWSLGEGDVQTVGPAELLAFSFYAAGPLKTYRNGNFAMYWLTDPPIAPSDVAARIQKLYAYMSNFFDDANAPYRVFIRHNPHRGGGGTALAKSFMFGWNEATAPTLDSMQDLLAHEMTHNWPKIAGEHGDTAWYSEGNAEFYSLVLSYRAGVLTPDQFLERINKRAADYYSNPLRNVSNGEAAKRFWSDWSAQRIPYGRGFLYLALTDAKIRAKSNNKHSLDDIVLAIQAQQRAKKTPGIADWIALVGKEIGADAQRDYDSMAAGRPVVPTGAFGPCFKLVATKIRPFELGFDEAGLMGDKKIVRGLVAGSAAAQAGLQEGDEIVQASDTLELSRKPDDAMLVRVKRGDGEKLIAYVPRGAAAQSYGWVRNTKIADSACRL